ncbi:type IV pilus modification PilV family protein [Noviherbaspirillum sp.]|uniref:type IV pilus modification PilV family protein n=1 Tax=Noviherbaspirillum sp. TaxID=1926288 RepID=UPI002FE21A55
MSIRNAFGRVPSQRGLTMIELVMFIVIISVAVIGILQVMATTTGRSADPQVRKQALAVAEALLEEVLLMRFTACDPDGISPLAPCALLEAIGPEPGETRGSTTQPFDNVNDYHGFTLAGGGTAMGNAANVVVPSGYSASVSVAPEPGFGPAGQQVPQASVLRVTVNVTYSGGTVSLQGYRTLLPFIP